MQALRNWLFKSKIGGLVASDIIVQDEKTKSIYLGGVLVTDNEVSALQAEIKALEGMRIWSILNNTPKNKALEIGWNASTTLEHLNTGKTMYHTLDLQQSIINILKKKVVAS